MIIDTDTCTTSHLADLKARGVTHIGRYYAAKGSKRLTKDEARAISDAGLQVFVVYEDSGDPELTIARGIRDAGLALAQAKAIGQPAESVIYFALEHLPSGYDASHIPGIKLYFEGIRQGLGPYKAGCYSNGTTLAALLDASLIDYAWVSASTSFAGSREFLKTKRWHLAQRKVDQNWGGVSTDTNDVQGDGFGAWALPPKDNIDQAMRDLVQAPSVAALTAPSTPEPVQKAAFLDRLSPNAAKIEELASQGSRIAEHLKSFKAMIWKALGTFLTLIGLGSQVDTNKGTAQTVSAAGADHPLLLALLCIGVTAAICLGFAYYKAKKVEKGLVTAAKDGRYEARAAA